MMLRLPYGRRLACYWRPAPVRLAFERFCGSRMLRVGRLLLVCYWNRMDWTDLDRKVEASYQRKRGAK